MSYRFEITGRGTVFAVETYYECADFDHLLNREVQIDDKKYLVRGVERYCIQGPYRAGTKIGLLVREVDRADALKHPVNAGRRVE